MKKIIVFLLTAVMCLTVLSVAMSAVDEVSHHDTIHEIVKFTPVLDGKLDAQYAYSTKMELRDYPDHPKGETAKGTIYYLWDDAKLYFYVDVQDATPTPSELVVDHNGDCIEMLFSLYNYDVTATNITSKQMSDIGDAQFRVMRDKEISACTTVIDNGLDYEKHGGYGKYISDNNDADNPENGSNYIIHESDENGYRFEGFVVWGDQLQNSEYPIGENSIIGLGIQVNDDMDGDNKRDQKVYGALCGNNDMSMSGNRATCAAFKLVDTGLMDPGTSDPAIIFSVFTIISAGGFTLFAAKKAKKD